MPPKPPSDSFTRFTSTAPSSSSSSSSSSRTSFSPTTPTSNPQPPPQPSQSTAPPNETPSERVARLRAAHRATQTSNQLSAVDRLISRGRSFADIAHRVTTYSLLAITGVSSVIAVYGLVSLISHNRRQKRAWIEREMDRLAQAQQAFLRGEANAEQLHLLEQERAGEEIAKKFAAEKRRRKEEGTWNRIKGTFGGFMGGGDMGVETAGVNRQGPVQELSQLVEAASQQGRKDRSVEQRWNSDQIRPVAVQRGPVDGVGLDEKGRPIPINKVERVKREGEREVTARTGIQGGPLDVLADNVVDKASSTGQTWWQWIAGGSSSSSSGKSSPSPTSS